MSSPASVKQELHELIDGLSPEAAMDLLDYINMLLDPDELTDEEEEAVLEARREFERGETVSHEEIKRDISL